MVTTQVYLESAEDEELHAASCTGTTVVPLELTKCNQCDKAYSRKQVRLSSIVVQETDQWLFIVQEKDHLSDSGF
jgi:hypothetical protein